MLKFHKSHHLFVHPVEESSVFRDGPSLSVSHHSDHTHQNHSGSATRIKYLGAPADPSVALASLRKIPPDNVAMLRQALTPSARLGLAPAIASPYKTPLRFSLRAYSVAAHPIADLHASTLTVEKSTSPKHLTPHEKLVFGHTFTGTLLD
jgi:hypothetical protein